MGADGRRRARRHSHSRTQEALGLLRRPRDLRFNWRIIQAPRRLVDYVVGHELVHLVHPDHDREFWALLGRAMPDYEKRREALRHLGRRLEW